MCEMAPCVSASDWSARMLCVCPNNAGCKHRLLIGRWHVECMSHQVMGFWKKKRTPTSDCQVVFIGVSPSKYDNFHLVIDLFKRSCCFFLTPQYYDSFMIWPTVYAPTMLVPPTPSFEQFLKINSISFRKASERRYHIIISEISRIYKRICSLIHKTTPTQKSKMKQKKYSTTISRS